MLSITLVTTSVVIEVHNFCIAFRAMWIQDILRHKVRSLSEIFLKKKINIDSKLFFFTF
jgi:hypothetical protein